jgi:hypothetical protein
VPLTDQSSHTNNGETVQNRNRVTTTEPKRKQAPTPDYPPPNDVYAHVEVIAPPKEETKDSPALNLNARSVAKETASHDKGLNDTIKNVNVVLQKNSDALSEVVVINRNKSMARQDAKKRSQPTIDTLEPAGGWPVFDDYVANNLKMPEQLKEKPSGGEVELAFEINKQGEPVNITVVKSLCEKCDEEAIRLLKEGPKWKNNKKKATLKIRF